MASLMRHQPDSGRPADGARQEGAAAARSSGWTAGLSVPFVRHRGARSTIRGTGPSPRKAGRQDGTPSVAVVLASVGTHGNLHPGIKDRKSVVEGKSVSVRVGPGGLRCIKKKKN